jgi:hypothetical protein
LAAKQNEAVRSLEMNQMKPASAAAIIESMVATEAELQALWAEHDGFMPAGCRPSAKRIGVV